VSGSIQQLTDKVKTAQIELERLNQALYKDVNSPNLHAAYMKAITELDKAEAELEDALIKFKLKRY